MQSGKGVRKKKGNAQVRRKMPTIIAIILVVLLGIFSGPVSSLIGKQNTEELIEQLESYVYENIAETNFIEDENSLEQPTTVGTDVEGSLQMYVIDVGQADAILFVQDDQVMLVDAGTSGGGDEVVRHLKELGIEEIDILIGTHPHSDHMGGISKVLKNFTVRKFYFPRRTDVTTTYYINILEFVVENNIPCGSAEAGDVIPFGEGQIKFVTSTGPKQEKDLNNCSIVIRVTFGEIDFFLGGDIEKEIEEEILASGIEIESEVYKASHHGSHTSNTREIMEAIDPECIIISCGKDNTHNHPHKSVIGLFEELGIPVYRTDEAGTITITTDGKTVVADKEPGSYISGEE